MPRKGENIYRRKDGRWEARYIHHYENGKAKYRSVYDYSYLDVKAKRIQAVAKMDSLHVSTVKQHASIDEICRLWLEERKADIKESTYTRYARNINKYIIPGFAVRRLDYIDSDKINEVQENLREKLSNKTVSDIMCVFKSIWKYGQDHNYPCCQWRQERIKLKKANKITVIPTAVQQCIVSALNSYNEYVIVGILFTLLTGVRIGEICGLRWGDIDLENGYVHIRRTIERIADLSEDTAQKTKVIISEPKTENSIRTIPLPDYLVRRIKPFQKDDDFYVLTGSLKHTEPHTFYTRYKTFLRKNKLGDYTFHELRHTFATLCVDRGFDIKSLSEILGHSDVKTTMNLYVHPTLQMKKRQMDTLSL